MLKKVESSAIEYSKSALKEVEWRMIVNKRVFVLLNSLSISFVMFGSILTTLVLSKHVSLFLESTISKDINGNKIVTLGVPNWYYFLAAGISSFTTLISGIINFFIIRDKIKLYTQKREDILYEIVSFNNRTVDKYNAVDREYVYYKSIAAVLGSHAIRKVREK